MKIRILSDLHLDVNSGYNLKLKDKDVFTILAGDTSGDPLITEKWVRKNVNNGIIISGNHLVYNNRGKTIQELRNEMSSLFPIDSNVSYLDSECEVMSKVVNGILFIGTTMYTDFLYHQDNYFSKSMGKEEIANYNMRLSARCMNDFRWGRIEKDIKVGPTDYREWFSNAYRKIGKIVKENEKLDNPLPIVLITHHCLSPECIDSSYVDSGINSSYVSDMESFLKKHSSIKLVVSGHVHSQKIFDIKRKDGSVCKYVLNPRGYCCRCEDMGFNENTFVDTDTWEVETTPKSKSRQAKDKKRLNNFISRTAWFL